MTPEWIIPQLNRLSIRIGSAGKIALFSDFDGTLTAIRDKPSECCIDPMMRQTLSELASRERIAVGIISGRDIEDVRSRIGIDGIAYAGNHGLEIEGPGFVFREPGAVATATALQELVTDLGKAAADFPGAWIQDKGLSVSVHYRQVKAADARLLTEAVQRVIAASPNARKFAIRKGKMVLEIRPAVNWHKGKAMEWLIRKISPNAPEPLLIYFGDDDTDEDVFRARPEDITVHVGDGIDNTSARYFVHDPGEVHAVLRWLIGIVGSRHKVAGG